MVNIPAQYQADVTDAANATGLPASVVAAQINAESGFQTGVVSNKGAEGIAQFLPSTWRGLGCSGSPFNAKDSFRCYSKYMSQLLRQFHGNVRDALAAYNAGPGNLQAGYGYADSILAAAGQPRTARASGGRGVQKAQLASAAGDPLLGPLDPFTLIDNAFKEIAHMFSGGVNIAESVGAIASIVAALGKTLNTIFTDLLWLFKPSHWIRIMAFGFGIMFLLPGIWMLSKTGRGEGDMSLALGILLVMVAAMLLFIAFHNLPDDVQNIKDLLGWLSSEIRSNSPATTG